MTYRFSVSPKGIPLQLSMLGINLYTGGHKDEYLATYTKYEVCARNSIRVIILDCCPLVLFISSCNPCCRWSTYQKMCLRRLICPARSPLRMLPWPSALWPLLLGAICPTSTGATRSMTDMPSSTGAATPPRRSTMPGGRCGWGVQRQSCTSCLGSILCIISTVKCTIMPSIHADIL